MISVKYGELRSISNPAGKLSVETKTGFIRSLSWNGKNTDLFKQLRQNIPGYIGGIRIYDELEKKWYSDHTSSFKVSDFKAGSKKISFKKDYKGSSFLVKITFTAEKDSLDWAVEIEKKSRKTADRGLRVYFFLPMIAGWEVWAPAFKGEFTFDGMTSFEYMYGQIPGVGNHEITVPVISHFSKELDIGFSVIVPYDKKVPASKFQFQNGEKCFNWGNQEKDDIEKNPVLEVVNYYIGVTGNRKLKTSCKIFLHEGDWRPGLGLPFEKYKEYFVPETKTVYKNEGIAQCCTPHLTERMLKERKLGVKFLEFHGHFAWYGCYFPEEKSWRPFYPVLQDICKKRGQMSLQECWKKTLTMTRKELEEMFPDVENIEFSREFIKKELKKLKRAGINVFWYINYSDGFVPWAERYFKSSLAKNEKGELAPSGYFSHHLLNPDIKLPFAKYMLKTVKNIFREYPMLDGFFLDCFRHYEIDFAHDDGITVVNNKPCYSVNFAFDEINTKIHDILVKTGRNNYANKPQTIRCMKSVDAQLLEGDGDISEEKFFYLSLAKPFFYYWTSNNQSDEENLRRAVVLGGFPRAADYNQNSKEKETLFQNLVALYKKYLPLYEHFRERVLCFEPDPLRVPAGMRGKLYTVKDGYVAGIMNEGINEEDNVKFGRTKYAYFRVKKGFDIGVVEIMYPGDRKLRKVNFMFNGAIIAVPLQGFKNCAVIKLNVTGKTGKPIGPMKFSEAVDTCGDPKTAFEELK